MNESKRVRWPLLVLLWIWAACVFLLVDLFWTVPEFDGVRPRASLYRGMRVAAHEMVGKAPSDESMARVTTRSDRTSGLALAAGDSERLREELDRIGRGGDANADSLLALRSRIPVSLRGEYAVALAMAAARDPGRRFELAEIALLELCRGDLDWNAVAGVCHRLDVVVHGFEDDPRFALPVARLRVGIAEDLSNERALAAAVVLATPTLTARVLTELQELPLDEDPPRWLSAAQTILRHGDSRQRSALSDWATEAGRRVDSPDAHGRLRQVGREAMRR